MVGGCAGEVRGLVCHPFPGTVQAAASACLGVGMGRLFLEYVEAQGGVTNKVAQGFGRLAPGRLLSVTGHASV